MTKIWRSDAEFSANGAGRAVIDICELAGECLDHSRDRCGLQPIPFH